MASRRHKKNPLTVLNLREERNSIGYNIAHLGEECLSGLMMAALEVVPSPQGVRMNDRDRVT